MLKKIVLFIIIFVLVTFLINSIILVKLDNPVRLTLAYGIALIVSGFSVTRVK
ncbi:hypothetical protein [Streptococcus pluranimalium]|uniref:Phosphoribosylaminoimidazolecarboxamide formyltransferase n=1 Tax=Streptococcus pluranimalium TaxID=82348 RepID=A0A345VH43_9STRE|nr:hypothetical protein [Streptococcus pluranimalium]AXJ12045.1 hypothetical protein Sp14A_00720 [Streptococcus pluranimalium]MDY3042031.1 hypothetical protein [Streptococcus pluranimalium]HEM6117347.1 hypothetical protein [Streptococcus suis]